MRGSLFFIPSIPADLCGYAVMVSRIYYADFLRSPYCQSNPSALLWMNE
jgi:hypothetical protein